MSEPSRHQVASRTSHRKSFSNAFLTRHFRILRFILPWVGFLIIIKFNKAIVTSSNEGAQKWPYPVNPVVVGEVPIRDTGAERSSRIEGTAGEVDS